MVQCHSASLKGGALAFEGKGQRAKGKGQGTIADTVVLCPTPKTKAPRPKTIIHCPLVFKGGVYGFLGALGDVRCFSAFEYSKN